MAKRFSTNPKRKRGKDNPRFRFGLAGVMLAITAAGSARAAELPPQPIVAPGLTAAPTAPAPPPRLAVLRAGEKVTLRILQVIPADGLSPGERLLNSRNPILPGDHFLAEVIEPHDHGLALVGGSVAKLVRPGWFGRPGYVTLELAQMIETTDGEGGASPWQVNTEDRELAGRMRRTLVRILLGLEGGVIGTEAGAQSLILRNGIWLGSAAMVGVLVGVAYSSLQRGAEPTLEPGDTFRITVGAMRYRPVSREWETILHPAADPAKKKGNKR